MVILHNPPFTLILLIHPVSNILRFFEADLAIMDLDEHIVRRMAIEIKNISVTFALFFPFLPHLVSLRPLDFP